MRQLGAHGLASSTLGILEAEAWLPTRIAHARPSSLPNIQFDINDYIAPARNIHGTLFRFGPVHTLFITAQLKRTPTRADRHVLSEALDTIEATYPFSPSGVFPLISYGLPYFNRLPTSLLAGNMPRLVSDHARSVLEEAVPGLAQLSP